MVVLLVVLCPLLFCPNRVPREFVPIMMMPGGARRAMVDEIRSALGGVA